MKAEVLVCFLGCFTYLASKFCILPQSWAGAEVEFLRVQQAPSDAQIPDLLCKLHLAVILYCMGCRILNLVFQLCFQLLKNAKFILKKKNKNTGFDNNLNIKFYKFLLEQCSRAKKYFPLKHGGNYLGLYAIFSAVCQIPQVLSKCQ